MHGPNSLTIAARYLSARVIKVVGNFLKLPCYLLHFVCPKARFLLPHRSGPIVSVRSRHRIPKIIWQTNYTDRVTLAVYMNYLFNRMMAPTYEYRFMDDSEQADSIKQHYPSRIVDVYSKLQIGAAQADFWRILVLRHCGGVYLDIDAHIVWPLGFIIKPELAQLYLWSRDDNLTNYFIASAADNPHLDLMIDRIVDNIEKVSSPDVGTLTGPEMMTAVLGRLAPVAVPFRYTCYQGTFTNEFFQYVDHPQGKWSKAQKKIAVVKG